MSNKINLFLIFCVFSVVRNDAKVLRGVTIQSPPYYSPETGKGFVVDLLNEIQSYIKTELNETFDYTLELTPDGRYGAISNGTINGMLGQLYNRLADFAIADITIKEERKQFVDFTVPFIEGSIAIIVRKDNAKNSTSVADLADRPDISVGCLRGGSICYNLSRSEEPAIARLYERMVNEDSFADTYREGAERVKSSKFAFLGESPVAQYFTSFDCELTSIKDETNLYPIQYGIAFPKGVDHLNYVDQFNSAITHLKSSGKINTLWNRYWKEDCNVLRGVYVIAPPYVVTERTESGNNRLTGFAIEMLEKIAAISGFNYTLNLASDGKYGVIKNGTVNGMIADVYIKSADFALGDITVTPERSEYVNFTEPFIDTSLAILVRKDYGTNITSFADLANQTDIPYGAITYGSTMHSLSQSEDTVSKTLYEQMQTNPERLTNSIRDGVERVKNSRYAYILEASSAKYLVGQDCSLKYIEETHFPKHYAIALAKNSVHKEKFDSAIRQLKSSGELDIIYNKYWRKCQE